MQIEQFKIKIVTLRQKLFIVACKYLQNEEDAEDMVQETLLRLWNIREQLDTVLNPEAFAMQTLKNHCIDRLRTQKEQTKIDDFSVAANDETPYSIAERKNTVEIVKQVIVRLPELQRTIIRMRDIEGYELTEIADITGTQIAAVTMNLSRARKKVRETYLRIINYELL
jgi:RNA polymerase sigma-70 factor (ECF subfamily)